ncbi:MAG: PepSY domain-containing protein [Acidiferrobacterales bacterium]
MKFFTDVVTLCAFLAVFGLGISVIPIVWAAERYPPTIVAQTGLTAQEAAAMVQARTGGRILAIKTIRSDGQVVYRIKVLTPDGEVRIFHVDAATGSM